MDQPALAALLHRLADEYETANFLANDPSRFMHEVDGDANREATAFVAASLSFGRRDHFMGKVRWLLDCAENDMERFIRSGAFERFLRPGDSRPFYRFFTCSAMNAFLRRYKALLECKGSLGSHVKAAAGGDAGEAIKAICAWFGRDGGGVVPKDASSACKRVAMFLRWMVRGDSPVDLGLWRGFISPATLVMPLDTHVMQEAARLGLCGGKCSSMAAARRLTAKLAAIFPGDPCRADFALFGLGVSRPAASVS